MDGVDVLRISGRRRRLLALACALVLVFGSCMTVCASGSLFQMLDFSYIDSACMADHYIIYSIDDVYYLDFSDSYFDVLGSSNINVSYKTISTASYPFADFYRYKLVNNEWVLQSFQNGGGIKCFDTDSGNFIYTSHDLLYNGEVFFQQPVISPLTKVVMMISPEIVLGQILGLLPLLIPCLVGLVAFSKGWRFLLSILQKA